MSIEAMKMALEALEDVDGINTETECVTIDVDEAITALRQAIEKAEKHKKYSSKESDVVMDYDEWANNEEDISDMLVDLKEQYLKVFEENDKRWKK